MKIAIVTNSYQRTKNLVERSLFSSHKQNPSPEKIIFIDQNSPPLKLDLKLENATNLNHILNPVSGVSKARNSFAVPEDYDWMIFCDDDGYFMDNYLEVFTEFVKKNPKVDIIAGSIVRDDTLEFYSPRHKIGGDLNKFQNTKLLMGSNFAVRPHTFLQLGKFSENFGAGSYWGSSEETDFAWKAFFANVPMVYVPELKVLHIRPYAGTFVHSSKKAFRYGVGKGAMVMKWLLKGKLWPWYEFFEMTTLPLALALYHLLKLNPKNSFYSLCTFTGRIFGFLKYPFAFSYK